MYAEMTRFPNGEPEFLYRRDSPWISSYHIQNSFQAVNQFILTYNRFKHGFNYYKIRRICSTNLLQAYWAKLEQTENGSSSWSSGHPSSRTSSPQAALERSTGF